MIIAKAKKVAEAAGLELFYDRQWTSWGLIDPDGRVESEWFSSNGLKGLTADQFDGYITKMHDKIKTKDAR